MPILFSAIRRLQCKHRLWLACSSTAIWDEWLTRRSPFNPVQTQTCQSGSKISKQTTEEAASPVRVRVHHLGAHLVDFGSVCLQLVRLLRGALPLLALDEFILQLPHPQLQLLHGRHRGVGGRRWPVTGVDTAETSVEEEAMKRCSPPPGWILAGEKVHVSLRLKSAVRTCALFKKVRAETEANIREKS